MASWLEPALIDLVESPTKLWPWGVATEVYPGPDPAVWGEDPVLVEGQITSISVMVFVTTVVYVDRLK